MMQSTLSTTFAMVLGFVLVCWSASAFAQDAAAPESSGEPAESAAENAGEESTEPSPGGVVEPTREQKDLNDEGVQALIAKEYTRAVALLEESASLGDLNITYLNLGRAYQKLGQCEEARSAYLKAVSAPPVAQPPQGIIDEKADQYLAELRQECEFADATQAGGEAEQTSPVLSWALVGGGAALTGFAVFSLLQSGKYTPVIEDDTRTDGIITGTTQREAFDRRAKANTWRTIGVSVGIVGLTAAGVGTYMLLSRDSMESQPTAVIGPDGSWRVGWSVRF